VNVVKAGLVETDSTRRIPHSEEIFASRKHHTMMGDRMLNTRDVADAVARNESVNRPERIAIAFGYAVYPSDGEAREALFDLLEDAQTPLVVRIGLSAILEELAEQGQLEQMLNGFGISHDARGSLKTELSSFKRITRN